MYKSPDTPLAIKKKQQEIWLAKPISERLILSLQMIEDARLLQIHGVSLRYPDWTMEEIQHYILWRRILRDPTLTWMKSKIVPPKSVPF